MKTSRFLFRFTQAAFKLLLASASLTSVWAQQRAVYQNPVIAGDFPDPSIIRVGQDYWATATSGGWAPEFQILHSRDLVNWEVISAVFDARPAWAVGDFWAPEISEYHGRYFVYYTGRKKHGPLCVAVASAPNPSGPYTDYGPLVCQEIGSIDPMAVVDEDGSRYLIWKEDGNSRHQPTPIWAQRLNEDGTKLVGSKKELIRNDPKSWEGGIVEGAFILRHDGWFYLFYSGNACCGRSCHYAMGVARSRNLFGTWEKNPSNPILAENQTWQCPGHGSIVSDERGRNFLLYHAYQKSEEAFSIGREAMLDEVEWGADGWPLINHGQGPSKQAPDPIANTEFHPTRSFFDDFNSSTLKPGWQWPQENAPLIRFETERGSRLILTSTSDRAADPITAVLAQPERSGNYVATTLVDMNGMKNGELAGLSAYSWHDAALGIAAGSRKIIIYTREAKNQQIVKTLNLPPTSQLYLRMTVHRGAHYRFAYSTDEREWKDPGEEIDGSFLEGVRVSLTVGGSKGASAKFEWIRITPE
jgi:xylan 1,4-beta-xylosidase